MARDSLAAEIGAVYTGYYASVSEGAPVYMGQIMGTITQRLSKYGICLRGDISACLLTISVRPTAPHLTPALGCMLIQTKRAIMIVMMMMRRVAHGHWSWGRCFKRPSSA